jgi:hypothetical protein
MAEHQRPDVGEIKPALPAGFNNRLAANWRLLLAITEQAGAQWRR